MSYYRTREGQVTAADSFTVLSGLYGQSTTSSVQLPTNTSRIVGIIASFASDGAANAATTFAVKLEGDGLSQGSEIMTYGAHTTDGTPVSTGQNNDPFQAAVDIPIVANNQVSISVAMSGDTGTCEAAVTLVLQ
tara:strand:+ start:394 stop:795 length:402 start_codon:yes stop_codon:yes gene_type:complete